MVVRSGGGKMVVVCFCRCLGVCGGEGELGREASAEVGGESGDGPVEKRVSLGVESSSSSSSSSFSSSESEAIPNPDLVKPVGLRVGGSGLLDFSVLSSPMPMIMLTCVMDC